VYGTNLVTDIQSFQGFQYEFGVVTIIFDDQDVYIIHKKIYSFTRCAK